MSKRKHDLDLHRKKRRFPYWSFMASQELMDRFDCLCLDRNWNRSLGIRWLIERAVEAHEKTKEEPKE